MNADEKHLGERIKATIVAICLFKARHPSSVSNPDSLRREAEDIEAYAIASKRHLQAMRSELDATIRESRRQVSRGYWPRRTYDRLIAHLKDEGHIDISTWVDTDAERMKKILDVGEIRTLAQWRLAAEYRDTIDGPEQRRIDDLIGLYEAKRDVRRTKAANPRAEAAQAPSAGSKITSDNLAFAEVLRRSAMTGWDYAASRDEASADDERRLQALAETWRTFKIATPRDIKDMEKAFWISMTTLRNRLTDPQFQELTQRLQQEGLVDISGVVKARNPLSARASKPRG